MDTAEKPQTTYSVEILHQTFANMVNTIRLEESEDLELDWNAVLSTAAYWICSRYHTTLKAIPGQLVFGQDMILNIRHVSNCRIIRQQKQNIIQKNSQREKKRRTFHQYRKGEKKLYIISREISMRNLILALIK